MNTEFVSHRWCWHNNHHAFPGSARLALALGEWDLGWWALLALEHLGLVWALRLPEDLAYRPELIDNAGLENARAAVEFCMNPQLRPVDVNLLLGSIHTGARPLLLLQNIEAKPGAI